MINNKLLRENFTTHFSLYLIVDGTNIFVFERCCFYKTNVHLEIFCEAMNSLSRPANSLILSMEVLSMGLSKVSIYATLCLDIV